MFRIDLDKNPRAKQKLQALLGEKIDLSQFAVFEARANDTQPITGAGGFLKNARMTKTYLSEMVDHLQTNGYVPIIELHDQQGSLPKGRIFDAAVFQTDGSDNDYDLHILFYVPAEEEYAKNIDNGIIAELSTGTTPQKVLCSACDFDFLLNETNRDRLYAGKGYRPLCDKGHQWGVGGNHLRLSGLDKWRETSVVTRGAVTRARILGGDDVKLANAEVGEINLSSANNDDTLLFVTLAEQAPATFLPKAPQTNIPTGGDTMEIKLSNDQYTVLLQDQIKLADATRQIADLTAKLTEAQGAVDAKAAVEAELATAKTEKTDLEAKLAEAQTKITTLEAQLGAGVGGVGSETKDTNKTDLAINGLNTSYFKQA